MSLVVYRISTRACHARERGSTPRQGGYFCRCFSLFIQKGTVRANGARPIRLCLENRSRFLFGCFISRILQTFRHARIVGVLPVHPRILTCYTSFVSIGACGSSRRRPSSSTPPTFMMEGRPRMRNMYFNCTCSARHTGNLGLRPWVPERIPFLRHYETTSWSAQH